MILPGFPRRPKPQGDPGEGPRASQHGETSGEQRKPAAQDANADVRWIDVTHERRRTRLDTER